MVSQRRARRACAALERTGLDSLPVAISNLATLWIALGRPLLKNTRALPKLNSSSAEENQILGKDPIWDLLAEWEALDPNQKDELAKNLFLLWEHFRSTFDGVGGFLAEAPADQARYLENLLAASQRMKPARGSSIAFYYVTVELMRQYICCLKSGRFDRAASSLASCAAMLIDRGRVMAL